MRRVFKDERLQREFERAGYARAPMLDREEVARLVAAVAEMRPHDRFAPDRSSGLGITYHCTFLDTNVEYKRRAHELVKEVFDPHVRELLEGYEIHNCNFYVKPPGTGEFAVHQNWPAIADLDDTTVTLWCPLTDVVESNGALQVVEGSHKLVRHVESPAAPAYFTNFKDALIEKYLKAIPMNAGEGVVFDDGMIHWSARNDSDRPRVAIQILCVPADATPAFFFKENDKRFEVVRADSDFYLESALPDLLARQPQWEHVGYAENANRFLTEAEFARLLDGARDARARGESFEGHFADRFATAANRAAREATGKSENRAVDAASVAGAETPASGEGKGARERAADLAVEPDAPAQINSSASQLADPVAFLRRSRLDLARSMPLARRLLGQSLAQQYRYSSLGLLWAFVPPLVAALVFVVNSEAHGSTRSSEAALYAVFGVVLAQSFVDTFGSLRVVISRHKNLLSRQKLAVESFVLAQLGEAAFGVAVRALVLVGALAIAGRLGARGALFAVAAPAAASAVGAAVGLLMAPWNALNKDLDKLLSIAPWAVIVLTPTFAPARPGSVFDAIHRANPLTFLYDAARNWSYGPGDASLLPAIAVVLAALVVFAFAWLVCKVSIPHVAERAWL